MYKHSEIAGGKIFLKCQFSIPTTKAFPHKYVTGSAETLHVRVFYTSLQKQLLSHDSTTNFSFLCTKIKLGNFFTDTEISTIRQIMYKLWHLKIAKIGQKLHVNMGFFCRAGHILVQYTHYTVTKPVARNI